MSNLNNFEINDEIMAKINVYTRKELTSDEVYAFPVILCDNDIDRDYERFSVKSLEALAELFIGKTGILGENQTARIFDAEVKTDKSKKTADGNYYTYLLAKAYMLKNQKTQNLISKIEAGIKKEVSISCKIDSEICSICGADKRIKPCAHIKGRTYGNKVCHTVLERPSDAYKWSFAIVPKKVNKKGTEMMDIKIKADKVNFNTQNNKLIIDINDTISIDGVNINKYLNRVKLGTLDVNDEFDIGNETFIVLEKIENGNWVVVIRKDFLPDNMKFGDNSDWRKSPIRKYLNDTYYKELTDIVGKENIIDMERDLTSLDGLDDYGTCVDKISLLTASEYAKYHKTLGLQSNYPDWQWLITATSTPSNNHSFNVCYVTSNSHLDWDNCNCHNGVRPFCVLNSSVLVYRNI